MRRGLGASRAGAACDFCCVRYLSEECRAAVMRTLALFQSVRAKDFKPLYSLDAMGCLTRSVPEPDVG